MDKKEGSSTNFMPDDLLEVTCILERGKKHNSYKIIRKRNYFFLIHKFPAKNGESTPSENCASARGTATHQDQREFSSDDKLPNKRRKRRRKSSHASRSASHHTDKKLKDSSNVRLAQQKPKKKSSARVTSQHTDKKREDSSDVQLAQPKPKKKSQAQVARDRARRREFWKRMRIPRQLRAENLALHYRLLAQKEASPQSSVVSQSESENSSCLDRTSDDSKSYQLQETETVASPQFSVVSQSESENFACLDRTSDVSQSSRYLTIEGDIVNTLFTAQVQSDLNKLSAEAAVEHSSISVDKCYDSTALRRCTGCKSSSYCSKDCQRSDWPSHKQLCKSIQSQNPQN